MDSIRVEEVPTSGEAIVVEPNRRYRLDETDRERCTRVDITGVDADAGRAYGFCADTGSLMTLEHVQTLVTDGRLRPVESSG